MAGKARSMHICLLSEQMGSALQTVEPIELFFFFDQKPIELIKRTNMQENKILHIINISKATEIFLTIKVQETRYATAQALQ